MTAAGFAAGGFVAANFFVSGDAALTAGPTTLLYAGVGALLGLAVAVLFLLRSPTAFQRVAMVSVIVGLATWGFVFLWGGWQSGEKSVATVEAPDTLPPPLPPAGTRDSLIALVAAPDDILAKYETRESDYEQKALAVYGRKGNYYLVGLPEGGRAWVRERDTGAAHPIEQLLMNRLNYLTSSWDLRIRDEAGAAAITRPVAVQRDEHGENAAKVLEFVHRPDGLWIKVDVLNTTGCDGDTPKVVASGWIPLWGADAKPTVWFFSRGC